MEKEQPSPLDRLMAMLSILRECERLHVWVKDLLGTLPGGNEEEQALPTRIASVADQVRSAILKRAISFRDDVSYKEMRLTRPVPEPPWRGHNDAG